MEFYVPKSYRNLDKFIPESVYLDNYKRKLILKIP